MPEIGGVFTSFDIAASALRAERSRMTVHANNLANVHTIRDMYGNHNPYRRQEIYFRAGAPTITGSETLGVSVDDIQPDYSSELVKKYLPNHPDADQDGYVTFPNVDQAQEMVDMMVAQRAFEANLASFESAKTIFKGALQIIA